MKNKKCPECGTINEVDAVSCWSCRTNIQSPSPSYQEVSNKEIKQKKDYGGKKRKKHTVNSENEKSFSSNEHTLAIGLTIAYSIFLPIVIALLVFITPFLGDSPSAPKRLPHTFILFSFSAFVLSVFSIIEAWNKKNIKFFIIPVILMVVLPLLAFPIGTFISIFK